MTVLGNGRIVVPEGVLDPGWIRIERDRIAAVGAGTPGTPGTPDAWIDVDLAGRTVVPGFVDMHVHGGGGASYTSGDPDEIAKAVAYHRAQGTTSTMAGLVSALPDVLERQVGALAEVVESGLVVGIHLEGPWLSEAKRGAHDPAVLRPPAPAEVERLLDLGRGGVKMVTIAPELPGALDAIRLMVERKVVAAVGHTDADYDTTRGALALGASVATHLYNGMPPVHHRVPGPIPALVEDRHVTIELVADGIHVHPAMLRFACRAAGLNRIALVTDAMAAAGMPDGAYDLGNLKVRVVDGQVRLADGDSLAGSTLTMASAFAYMVNEVGVPLEAASRMASGTPAKALGLTDVGALRPGLRADLVVLDDELKPYDVIVGGQHIERP